MVAESVFADIRDRVFKYRYEVDILVDQLAGGVPGEEKVIRSWIETNIGVTNEAQIQAAVAETMAERGLEFEKAVEQVIKDSKVNGFRRDPETGELFVRGYTLKAGIKEASNIRWPDTKWGPTRKGTKSYIPEHVFVEQERVGLGVYEPSRVETHFVQTRFGAAISRLEIVEDAKLSFIIVTDLKWTRDQWGELLTTFEMEGFGSGRSKGYGRFSVVRFDDVSL